MITCCAFHADFLHEDPAGDYRFNGKICRARCELSFSMHIVVDRCWKGDVVEEEERRWA